MQLVDRWSLLTGGAYRQVELIDKDKDNFIKDKDNFI